MGSEDTINMATLLFQRMCGVPMDENDVIASDPPVAMFQHIFLGVHVDANKKKDLPQYSNRISPTHPYLIMFCVALVLWIVYETFKNVI